MVREKEINNLGLRVFLVVFGAWWSFILGIFMLMLSLQAVFIFKDKLIALVLGIAVLITFNYFFHVVHRNALMNKKWTIRGLYVLAGIHFIPLILQLTFIMTPGMDNLFTAFIGAWLFFVLEGK